jgi:hypothetical protein
MNYSDYSDGQGDFGRECEAEEFEEAAAALGMDLPNCYPIAERRYLLTYQQPEVKA